jgi:hypothetical protein
MSGKALVNSATVRIVFRVKRILWGGAGSVSEHSDNQVPKIDKHERAID